MKLYHATTPRRAKLYQGTGAILKPVRGFTTLMGAMAWSLSIQGERTVFYEIDCEGLDTYKLPDHHNEFGEAWWIDADVPYGSAKCVYSAKAGLGEDVV